MANYKDIKGFQVQSLADDPVPYSGSWSSGGNLNEGRYAGGGVGTQTSALMIGGLPPITADVESYNGSSWTETTELNQARSELGAAGASSSSALAIGGREPPSTITGKTESYNGSAWTEVGDLNTGRRSLPGSTGIITAALIYGGQAPGGDTANCETWDGSSWTETGDLNTARREIKTGIGTTTAAVAAGGNPPPGGTASTETFNGSSCSNSPGDLNQARKNAGGFGTSTAGIATGGEVPAVTAKTESWDGSSWTEVADLGTARGFLQSAVQAPSAQGVVFGGYVGPPVENATEEWNFPAITSNILVEGQMWFNTSASALKVYGTAGGLPAATWSSGGNYPASIYAAAGFGTQDSAVVGSYAPGGGTEAASYNGTSWTVITDVSTDSTEKTGFGESNSNGYLVKGITENWNGSSWTEVADATNSFSLRTGFGAPGSAIVAAGESPPSGSNLVESWDGTSWTEVSELNTARYAAGGGGSGNTSGIIAGGTTGSNIDNSETWDGSSWTEGGNLNTARHRVGSAGKSVSSSLIFGGESITGKTESYNGTAWTELTDMTTARIDPAFGNIGVNVAALAVGGRTPPATNVTEEFTASAAVSTVTTS